MAEIHAAEGKVLRRIRTVTKGGRLQVGEARIEEIEPMEALQQIGAILEHDAFICAETVKGNDGHEYELVHYHQGNHTEIDWEFRRKFKAYI
jgi:hypothetical protein